ncbi:response regulator [Oceanibium sediminis]|uniref:response regulator n=1 Tax=Oceanibium sediminis TaxID=2026339 RepID=UPI000DD4DA28|nr:response regulator [Oceanibium sediminis]
MSEHTDTSGPAARIAGELPYLRRYARALTGDQARGDKYAATTLEAIIADPSSFDAKLPPKVALFSVFHTIWSTAGREVMPLGDMQDALEAKAQERLAELTPNAREAVLLSTMEGMSPDNIAAVMAVPQEEVARFLEIGMAEMSAQMAGRVLIVEDEPIIALDIQSIVNDSGHSVVGNARTRTEAVRLASEHAPDLLLCDVQLADGSSGIDAANDILKQRPDLPVVFITAYPERLLTGERPEPAFLITKPFTEEQVRLAVSQSLFFASSAALA